mgnify:CR=1 FL=1
MRRFIGHLRGRRRPLAALLGLRPPALLGLGSTPAAAAPLRPRRRGHPARLRSLKTFSGDDLVLGTVEVPPESASRWPDLIAFYDGGAAWTHGHHGRRLSATTWAWAWSGREAGPVACASTARYALRPVPGQARARARRGRHSPSDARGRGRRRRCSSGAPTRRSGRQRLRARPRGQAAAPGGAPRPVHLRPPLRARESLDDGGAVRRTARRRATRIYFVKGRPVRRLVEEAGALSPRRGRHARTARRATRSRRRCERGERCPSVRAFGSRRSLDRYDFRAVAREDVAGRTAIVLEFQPRPGDLALEG